MTAASSIWLRSSSVGPWWRRPCTILWYRSWPWWPPWCLGHLSLTWINLLVLQSISNAESNIIYCWSFNIYKQQQQLINTMSEERLICCNRSMSPSWWPRLTWMSSWARSWCSGGWPRTRWPPLSSARPWRSASARPLQCWVEVLLFLIWRTTSSIPELLSLSKTNTHHLSRNQDTLQNRTWFASVSVFKMKNISKLDQF